LTSGGLCIVSDTLVVLSQFYVIQMRLRDDVTYSTLDGLFFLHTLYIDIHRDRETGTKTERQADRQMLIPLSVIIVQQISVDVFRLVVYALQHTPVNMPSTVKLI